MVSLHFKLSVDMSNSRSQAAFEAAQKVIPGGVNSPVRSFKGVLGTPIFMRSAKGALLEDIDKRTFIDMVGSWGPMILGHNNETVVAAISAQLKEAVSFGAPTEQETALAALVCNKVESVERLRLVNSGTEAAMTAIRLARGVTGRDKIIKFEGCYHGHTDSLLVKAGSGTLTLGVPDSAGVPKELVRDTLIARFNDTDHLEAIFAEHGESVAALIVEPVAGNMGCILPQPGFLECLRTLCDKYGSLLIFDEVMTGFRIHPGGAQVLYGQQPDISIFGKVIGGGLPIGAIGGSQAIMDHLAPIGPVYQAGTLSGNPLATAAGLATLRCLEDEAIYVSLSATTTRLAEGLRTLAATQGVPLIVNDVCGMLSVFFTDAPKVHTYADAQDANLNTFREFFSHMLSAGVYWPPSKYESAFLSTQHNDAIIDRILEAAEQAFSRLT